MRIFLSVAKRKTHGKLLHKSPFYLKLIPEAKKKKADWKNVFVAANCIEIQK